MAERMKGHWRYRLFFLLFAGTLAFLQLLPLNPGPGRLPGPDLLLLCALAWTVIRPTLLPVWLLLIVFLSSDILLSRPPGLWTALAILGCEFLRSRRVLLRNATFFVEWLMVSIVVAGMTVVNTLILTIFAVPQPTFGLTVIQMIFTILAYPVVMVATGRAIGLTKTRGERETLGVRG